jgi:hypothetical protein
VECGLDGTPYFSTGRDLCNIIILRAGMQWELRNISEDHCRTLCDVLPQMGTRDWQGILGGNVTDTMANKVREAAWVIEGWMA